MRMIGLTQRLFPDLHRRLRGGDANGPAVPVPRIETSRLQLRPFTPADLPALEALYVDPETTRYLQNGPYRPARARRVARRALESAIEELAVFGYGSLALVEREGDGRMIGCCGVSALPIPGPERIELSYLLARDRRGRGLMAEAAEAVVADAFDRLGFTQLIAVSHPENTASLRLLERLGFRPAGALHCYGRTLPFYALDRRDAQCASPVPPTTAIE
ncbi:MAG TPA: GNAT family N-acetyltransferase [Alphaproteobacteria bacterium]|nr:GNAT family N-acetyltransferase [Alphaproteobacteria bacterium]